MRRVVAACALVVLLILSSPAYALITALTPLADFLEKSTVIVTASVQEIDTKRPAMILKVDETLKGKSPFTTMPVLLKGDARAVKRKESAELLKRLAVKTTVVVFAMKKEKKEEYVAWVYTNGTWFGMNAVQVDKEWRWSFLHAEPYLRKTYKGTTKEMIQTVRDALLGKKKPPPPNEKEKEGLGPVVEDKTSSDSEEERPRYAVVAPVFVLGPLVVLAMLFPSVFGGVLAAAFGGLRRWVVLFTTTTVTSTLHSLYLFFGDHVAGRWWGSPVLFWAVLCVIGVLGVVWAWKRHLDRVQAGEAPGRPGKIEVIVLAALSVAGLAMLLTSRLFAQPLLSLEWLPAVVLCAALWIGCGYAVYARLRPSSMTPAAATEAVVLTGLVVVSLLLGTTLQRASAGGFTTTSGEQAAGGESVKIAWRFRLPRKGAIASSPLVAGDRVYVAAAHHDPFTPHGAVYCLDRATGEVVWSFSDDEEMKLVFSSPVLAAGRVYVGEGFHTDSQCKVYCLDAATGKKLWDFKTSSHTESTPAVVDGRLYVGAGDDGVYCLDARTGKRLWNFPGFHVDAPPRVTAGRVYAGCGIGDEHTTTALLCLDASTGDEKRPPRVVWRMNTDLPVWGKPVVSDHFVYAGTGNGRVNEAAEKPAGEMLCLREKDGEVVWRKTFDDGILANVAADRRNLYFGCRDGHLYALRRKDGSLAWKLDLGSPVVSTPAVEGASEESPPGRLYAVAIEGNLACVEARTGRLIWGRDLRSVTNTALEVISSPALEAARDSDGSEVWRLYVGVTLVSTGRVGELICLEDRTQGHD